MLPCVPYSPFTVSLTALPFNSHLGQNRDMSTRKPYGGRARKLVITFDVGTTFSGVSYRQGDTFPKLVNMLILRFY